MDLDAEVNVLPSLYNLLAWILVGDFSGNPVPAKGHFVKGASAEDHQ